MSGNWAAALCFGLWAAVLGLGCQTSQEPAATANAGTEESEPGFEIPKPDLSSMDPQVARQLSDARRVATDAAADGNLDAETLGNLGDLFHAYELLDAAETVYAEAERLDPSSHRRAYMRGLVAFRQGRFETARDAFQRAYGYLPATTEAAAPERIATAWRLGQALRETRDLESATQRLQEAAASDQCPAAIFELGRIALEDDRPADAEQLFKRVLNLQEDAAQAYFPLGQALRLQDKLEEARTYLDLASERERSVGGRALCRDPLDAAIGSLSTGPTAWITRGQHARFAGDLEGALTAFRRAVELAPDDPIAHQALAKGFAETGDWAAAEDELRRALELQPDSPSLATDLATASLHLGKTSDARRTVEEVLDRRPDFAPALLIASRVDKAEGRFEPALERLIRASELRGETCRSALEKVDLLARLGRLDDARSELRACLQQPSLASGEGLRLAVALGRLGEASTARAYLTRLTQEEEAPGLKAQAYFGLAGLDLQAGEPKGAIELLQRAVDADPTFRPAQAALQQLTARLQND